MFTMGVRYANGEGVEQDQAKATDWYRKAVNAKDAAAALQEKQ